MRFMSAMGKNVIVVGEEDWFKAGGSVTRLTPSGRGLTGDDIEALGWQEWAGALVRSEISAADDVAVLIEGDHLSVRGFELLKGRGADAGAEARREAVIGFGLAEALFGGDGDERNESMEPETSSGTSTPAVGSTQGSTGLSGAAVRAIASAALGKEITIHGEPFTVAGVLSPLEKDSMIKGYDQDKAVFAVWSQDLSDYLFRSTIPTREIWVRAVDGRFDEVKERIEALGEELGYAVTIPVGALEDVGRIMKDLATVLVSLASFGLQGISHTTL
ncbi:MAG TPA: ABC transporter permease [Firmicutes bacterium]|nr:ABC transporter permease [Candidatus Fermentithermobacillaceae bacterium]